MKHMYYHIFTYIFQRLLRHLQGELFCVLKTIFIFCAHVGLQLLYGYLKNHIYFNVELKMLKFFLKMAQ